MRLTAPEDTFRVDAHQAAWSSSRKVSRRAWSRMRDGPVEKLAGIDRVELQRHAPALDARQLSSSCTIWAGLSISVSIWLGNAARQAGLERTLFEVSARASMKPAGCAVREKRY
jgi:hypothetical protein